MNSTESSATPPLCWTRKDFEQRLFFKGGKHTRVNSILTALLGAVLTLIFYACLLISPKSFFSTMFLLPESDFLARAIPALIVFFGCWSAAILFVKWRKLAMQRKALNYRIIPKDPDFILSGGNVDIVVDNIYKVVDEPRHFVLFNRITVALSNLKNLGRVGDVGDILNTQAEQDEAAVDTSYGVINGFIWAIPVLGFIGTVLGLSGAIGGFGSVLEKTDEMSEIKNALKGVTGGLSMAFVTTLQALVVALLLQLWITFLKKGEEEFQENCAEYCTKYVVNRLRILPFEQSSMKDK